MTATVAVRRRPCDKGYPARRSLPPLRWVWSLAYSGRAARMRRGCLKRRLTPSAELWGEGAPHEITLRDALLHVIEHASLHLGHLELTRQLVTQA
ncbi:MAG: DUF664 domain-containing protein [Chloroflexota bacterium]|nr:DUF664 domain-containing protein [Chloroflexota bacterium]